MGEPSKKTIKRLFALSSNRCAFPDCTTRFFKGPDDDISAGKICHIKAKSPGGPRYAPNQSEEERHAFPNLILLCGPHHDVIDAKPDVYTVEMLTKMKEDHERGGRIELEPRDTERAEILLSDYRRINVSNVNGPVIIDSPGAVGGNSYTFKTEKKTIKVMPPEASIGSDLRQRAYVKHLIDRYNQFASGDKTRRGRFSYGALCKNIHDNFGVKWELVPKTRFDELVAYLKKRIDRTRLACINKGKGQKSYSSFDDWCRDELRV